MTDRKIGPDGEELCHYFEQCRLEAYADPGSPYARAKAARDPNYSRLSPEPVTIGWGDTGSWKLGDKISQGEADERFRKRMNLEFGPALMQYVDVPLEQYEFDALSSILYNIGIDAFKKSTLRKKLNAGDRSGAAAQFLVWNKAKGKRMKGLDRRRTAEHYVFQGVPATVAIQRALEQYP